MNTYRAYQRDGRLPGPVQVPSFMTPGAFTALRDDDGEPQYDLNEVRDANRARPGSGRRVDPADVSTVRWSARREGILRDARAGRLVVGGDGRVDLSLLVDAPTASKNDQVRTRRAVQHLRDTGAFVGPDGSGRLTLSPYGDRVLSTFLRMDHPQRPVEE